MPRSSRSSSRSSAPSPIRPAGLAIPGHRPADGDGQHRLSRRLGRDRRRHGRRADRAADQRRRQYALPVVAIDRRRAADDHRHLQARHRPRYGAGAGPEPRRAGRAEPARGSAPPGRGGAQDLAVLADGGQRAVARRVARSRLCLQLCADPDSRTGCRASTASATCRSSARATMRCASGSIRAAPRRSALPPAKSFRRCARRTSRSPPASSASRPTTPAPPSSSTSRRRAASRPPTNSPTSSSAVRPDDRRHHPRPRRRSGRARRRGLWRQRLSIGHRLDHPRHHPAARAPTRSPPPKASRRELADAVEELPQGARI